VSGLERVVLDTSTLVSAALRVGSVPYQALTLALSEADVCACVPTLTELDTVLMRSKFDRYQPGAIRKAFAAVIRKRCSLFEVAAEDIANVSPSCRDPKDNVFLALCVACEADVLVSSDADLLVLHPWHGVAIMTPADFLQKMTTP
jgi:uncharacterized protein